MFGVLNKQYYRWFFALVCSLFFLMLPGLPVFGREELPEKDGSESVRYVNPLEDKEGFSAVLYDNTNGLPTSEANDIAQTGDGFLWIGNYSGLIRYDGETFERQDSTVGVTNVISLFTDSKDRLWIGTNDIGVAMMEKDAYRFWGTEEGLPSVKVNDINEDENGLIYIGTTEGIAVIDEDMNVIPLNDPRIDGLYIETLTKGKDGRIYAYSNNGDLVTLRDGEMAGFLGHGDIRIKNIYTMAQDRKDPDCFYIGTSDSTLYYGDPEYNFVLLKTVDISPLSGIYDIKLFGNQVWVCGSNGIGVLENGVFTVMDGLPLNNNVTNIMADYEGNLWFTSSRQGLMKIVKNRFLDVFRKYNLDSRVVNSTCMYEGRLFIGTDTGLVVVDEDKEKIVPELPLSNAETAYGADLGASDLLEMLDGCRIRSIVRDSQNRLWLSVWGSPGLVRYDHGEVMTFSEKESLLSDYIRVVFERPDGSVLVAHTGGVCAIAGNHVIERYGTRAGIVNTEILTVCSAENGDILAGSNGGGIYIINSKGTKVIGTKDGLLSGIVMRIKYDPELKVYWIITSNSIAYMDTDYHVTSVSRFPYSDNFDLYKNKQGDLWILSSNGIYVLPAEEMLANENFQYVHYDRSNGLPCVTTANSYSELTESGDLYLSGNSGAAKVNIDTPMEEISDLKMLVPYIDVDGARIYPDENHHFSISSNVRKLTIYSYVLNYSLTDPQVEYYMEGFDREPVKVRRSELDPIDYTNLPGGTYQFIVHLKDSLGLNDKTLTVTIEKKKAVTEQPLLYILLVLAAALIINRLNSAYMQKKTLKMEKERQEAVEKERLNTELQTASQIQESMLPHKFPPFPDRTEFEIFASMNPAREVGGDFYDFFLIDDDHLCLVIADVSGKGIPAALFMMVSMVIIRGGALQGISAGEILTRTNERICSNNLVDMFVTVWVGILEISTGKIVAANAGHEYPALMKNGKFNLLRDKHGLVIGGMEGIRYREYEIYLEPGDRLFVYTDGVPEATDSDQKMFGTDRMLAALNEQPEASPENILKNVRRSVDHFVRDAEQFDDLTMLCIEYKGKKKED